MLFAHVVGLSTRGLGRAFVTATLVIGALPYASAADAREFVWVHWHGRWSIAIAGGAFSNQYYRPGYYYYVPVRPSSAYYPPPRYAVTGYATPSYGPAAYPPPPATYPERQVYPGGAEPFSSEIAPLPRRPGTLPQTYDQNPPPLRSSPQPAAVPTAPPSSPTASDTQVVPMPRRGPVTAYADSPVASRQAVPAARAPDAIPEQQLSLEERAQRLRTMCNKGVLTPKECVVKRAELTGGK